jgi:hypothetical protein
LTNGRFNSVVVVTFLSLVLMLGSTTSAVLYTSKINAFATTYKLASDQAAGNRSSISQAFAQFAEQTARLFPQKSGNITLQTGDQPAIDQLANLIHNKTGIDDGSVKPILEQMAVQILKTKGTVPLNNTIASLTQVVKRPYTDIVSLSVYKLARDEAAGNRSSINHAISQFVEQIGDGKNPTAPLAQVAIQLTGGEPLTKNIDQITTELGNSTGTDVTSIKQILYLLTLLTADVFTNHDANNAINQIGQEVKANPMGPLGEALRQLSQEHFADLRSLLQLALLGHESIPAAITSEAIRTIGGYHMDWEIYKIANETHSKFGIAFGPVEQVLQQIALEIGNTGGRALSYNTLNNLTTTAAKDPVVLQSIFQLGKSQAAGNSSLVNLYVAQFSQQIDNGEKAIQTIKAIIPPNTIQNPPCIQDPKSPGCNYAGQFLPSQAFTRFGSPQLAAKILKSASHKFTIPTVIHMTYRENVHQNLFHSIAYWKPLSGLFVDEKPLSTQQPQDIIRILANTNSDPVAQINNGVSNSNNTGLLAKAKGCVKSPECVNRVITSAKEVTTSVSGACLVVGILGLAAPPVAGVCALNSMADAALNFVDYLNHPTDQGLVDLGCSTVASKIPGASKGCKILGGIEAISPSSNKPVVPSSDCTTNPSDPACRPPPPSCANGLQPDASGNCAPSQPQPSPQPSPQPPQPCDPVYGCLGAFVNPHYDRVSFLIHPIINSILYSRDNSRDGSL